MVLVITLQPHTAISSPYRYVKITCIASKLSGSEEEKDGIKKRLSRRSQTTRDSTRTPHPVQGGTGAQRPGVNRHTAWRRCPLSPQPVTRCHPLALNTEGFVRAPDSRAWRVRTDPPCSAARGLGPSPQPRHWAAVPAAGGYFHQGPTREISYSRSAGRMLWTRACLRGRGGSRSCSACVTCSRKSLARASPAKAQTAPLPSAHPAPTSDTRGPAEVAHTDGRQEASQPAPRSTEKKTGTGRGDGGTLEVHSRGREVQGRRPGPTQGRGPRRGAWAAAGRGNGADGQRGPRPAARWGRGRGRAVAGLCSPHPGRGPT